MLQRIDMVAVYVRDWVAAVSWYQELLGFSKLYVEDDHHFAVMGLPGGGAVLHLVGSALGDDNSRNRCAPNILVEDFDGTLDELRERAGLPGADVDEVFLALT